MIATVLFLPVLIAVLWWIEPAAFPKLRIRDRLTNLWYMTEMY